jgi:hypothetical protein
MHELAQFAEIHTIQPHEYPFTTAIKIASRARYPNGKVLL